MRMKPVIIAIAVLAALAIVGFLLWQKKVVSLPIFGQPSVPEAPKSLGGQIFEQTANPVKEKLPETNPFGAAQTNPLNGVYKNPF